MLSLRRSGVFRQYRTFAERPVAGRASPAVSRANRRPRAERQINAPFCSGTTPIREWCGREDSNFHGLSPTTTRSEEHTSELQSLMRISYAVFCLKKKTHQKTQTTHTSQQNTAPQKDIIR